MNEKLYEICEEVLNDKEKSKIFLNCETLDELYDYFVGRAPELTKDEFDEFICEALQSYEQEQNSLAAVNEENLEEVSGGAFDLRTKLASGALALLSMVPAAGAANIKGHSTNVRSSQSISKVDMVKTKISDAFQKTKAWIKAHPKLSAGVGIGAAILSTIAIIRLKRKSSRSDLGAPDAPNVKTDRSALLSEIKTGFKLKETGGESAPPAPPAPPAPTAPTAPPKPSYLLSKGRGGFDPSQALQVRLNHVKKDSEDSTSEKSKTSNHLALAAAAKGDKRSDSVKETVRLTDDQKSTVNTLYNAIKVQFSNFKELIAEKGWKNFNDSNFVTARREFAAGVRSIVDGYKDKIPEYYYGRVGVIPKAIETKKIGDFKEGDGKTYYDTIINSYLKNLT